MRVHGAGLYAGMREADYHADPAPLPSLSSGVASAFLTGTPASARLKHPRLNPDLELDDNRSYDLGSIAHELVLGEGRGIVVIEAEDWRTKAAKEERQRALADSKQPCLRPVFEKALAMAQALQVQIAADPENRDAFAASAGISEETAVWQDPATGLWMRARFDRRMTNRPAIYDYKTFAGERGADPEGFVRHIVAQGRDVQDPHYSTGLSVLLGVPLDEVVFRFVVQEPEPPYLIAVVELDAQTKEWSQSRYAYALNRWSRGMEFGDWPGFAPRTHYAGAPAYAQTQWEQRLIAEEMLAAVEAREAEAAE